jgi:hypothetical protein
MSKMRWMVASAWLMGGCAAAPPRAQTAPPQQREIVVDEAAVVSVPSHGARVDGPLPLLPRPLQATSPGFQQGFEQAQNALAAPSPAAPPDESQESYDAWITAVLQPWLEARGKTVQAALQSLATADQTSASEQVVAAALVGMLYARTEQQLLAVAPPSAVRADPRLLRIYQDQVNQTSASWVDSAVAALRQCASIAAQQPDPVFTPWLDRCQQELARLQQQAADAKALNATVRAESAADADAAPQQGAPQQAAPQQPAPQQLAPQQPAPQQPAPQQPATP